MSYLQQITWHNVFVKFLQRKQELCSTRTSRSNEKKYKKDINIFLETCTKTKCISAIAGFRTNMVI